jgi:hypothetical protein
VIKAFDRGGSIVGHICLTHILDGVLHGKIVPLFNPEVGPLYGIAEFNLSKPCIHALRLSGSPGLFGPLDELSDVPLAYPRKMESYEITAEILEKILVDAKEREKEGWFAPVYIE